uniref:Uncharacterized protein n=1 Tax=Oryza sativa subsp. japonica TaxID=39947 RepID=Q94HY7_ORYSJ|nr:hypothetical protein [Oryza sativa Japonica Group]
MDKDPSRQAQLFSGQAPCSDGDRSGSGVRGSGGRRGDGNGGRCGEGGRAAVRARGEGVRATAAAAARAGGGEGVLAAAAAAATACGRRRRLLLLLPWPLASTLRHRRPPPPPPAPTIAAAAAPVAGDDPILLDVDVGADAALLPVPCSRAAVIVTIAECIVIRIGPDTVFLLVWTTFSKMLMAQEFTMDIARRRCRRS